MVTKLEDLAFATLWESTADAPDADVIIHLNAKVGNRNHVLYKGFRLLEECNILV